MDAAPAPFWMWEMSESESERGVWECEYVMTEGVKESY